MFNKNKTMSFLVKNTNLKKDILEELSNFDSIKELVKRHKNLSKKELEYLLSSFNIEKTEENKTEPLYELSALNISMVISDKLRIIDVLDNKIYPYVDLDKLHMILNKNESNLDLYNRLVEDYIYYFNSFSNEDNKLNECFNSYNIISVILRNYNIVKEIFDSSCLLDKSIINLSFAYLEQLLNFGNNISVDDKKMVLGYLSEKNIENLNLLSSDSFNKFLEYLFTGEKNYRQKLVLFSNCMKKEDNEIILDDMLLKNIKNMPQFILERLICRGSLNNRREFLNSISEEDISSLIHQIIKTNDIHTECLQEVMINQKFYQLDYLMKVMILKRMRKVSDKEELSKSRYELKLDFLFGRDVNDKKGFISYLDDIDNLSSTLDFICTDSEEEVLLEKFRILERISKSLEEKSIKSSTYKRFLTYLDTNLSSKSRKDQIKILKSRSKYFKKHDIEEFFSILEQHNNISLDRLIISEQSFKQMKQNFKFIKKARKVDERVLDEIVNRLENSQSEESSKKIVDFISSSTFLKSDTNKQLELIKLLPGKTEKFSNSNSQSVVFIPDSDFVNNKINEHGGEMIFTNEDTGIKVKVITSKKC